MGSHALLAAGCSMVAAGLAILTGYRSLFRLVVGIEMVSSATLALLAAASREWYLVGVVAEAAGLAAAAGVALLSMRDRRGGVGGR